MTHITTDDAVLNHTPLSGSATPQQTPEEAEVLTIRPTPESAPISVDAVDSEPPGTESDPDTEELPMQEAVEAEIADKQLKQYVQDNKENIEISNELKKMGLKPVTSSNFPQYKNVKLPISDEKVVLGKQEPVTSSLRWLATFAEYLLWKAHISLKKIHGKVIRVIRK